MNIHQLSHFLAIGALLLGTTTSATALGIGSCDQTKYLCVTISTDKTIAPQTQVKSTLSYDVSGSNTLLESYEWINPNDNTVAVNLPIDLLTNALIKNINFSISEVNHLPLTNCNVKTPVGRKIVAGMLTLHLSYNVQTASYLCTP